MQDVSLKTVVSMLEELFHDFNREFYEGELETPVIAVSPDITKGAYGWCTSWRAWKLEGQEDGLYEINLCAEHLNRPFHEICATLLHEMVHLYCLQHDIQDTSRNGRYHNAKFKDVAEEHGLIIDKDPRYGWTITQLNMDTTNYLEKFDKEMFKLYRVKMSKLESKGKKSSSKKYVCPECGAIVRATKEVRILCEDCDCRMEEEE